MRYNHPILKYIVGQKVIVKWLDYRFVQAEVEVGDILTITDMRPCGSFKGNVGSYKCCCCEKCGGTYKKLKDKNGNIIDDGDSNCLGNLKKGYAISPINSLKLFLENGKI